MCDLRLYAAGNLDRYLAGSEPRLRSAGRAAAVRGGAASEGADNERFAGGLDDFLGHGAELVDFQDALDLGDESAGKAEVPATAQV
jgi:hypothetical protein